MVLNGEKEPIRFLCSSCHDAIHRAADALEAGKQIPNGLFTDEQLNRAEGYIRMIVLSKDGRFLSQTEEATGIIMLEPSVEMRRKLHVIKKRLGYTNLEDFILAVLKKIADKEQ